MRLFAVQTGSVSLEANFRAGHPQLETGAAHRHESISIPDPVERR